MLLKNFKNNLKIKKYLINLQSDYNPCRFNLETSPGILKPSDNQNKPPKKK